MILSFTEISEKLTKTFLDIMIKYLNGRQVCLIGGQKSLIKIIPETELDSEFLYKNVTINHLNSNAFEVIWDNNRRK